MSRETSQNTVPFGDFNIHPWPENPSIQSRLMANTPHKIWMIEGLEDPNNFQVFYNHQLILTSNPLPLLFALLSINLACEFIVKPENPLLTQAQCMQKFIQEYQAADLHLQATMRLKLSEKAKPYKDALDQAQANKEKADPVRALAAVLREKSSEEVFPSQWHSAKSDTLSTIASARALLEKMKSPTRSPSASGSAGPSTSVSEISSLSSELDLSCIDSETSNTHCASSEEMPFVIRGYLGFTSLLKEELPAGVYRLQPNNSPTEVQKFTMGYQEKWQASPARFLCSPLRADYQFDFSESLLPFLEKTFHYFILLKKRLKNIALSEGTCRLIFNLTPDEKKRIDSALAQAEIILQKFREQSPEISSLTWTVCNASYPLYSLRSTNASLLALETNTDIETLCQKLDEHYCNEPPAYFLLSSRSGSIDEHITLGIAAEYLKIQTEMPVSTGGIFGESINTLSLRLTAFPFFWNKLIPNGSDRYVSKILLSHISEQTLHIQFEGLSEAELTELKNAIPIAEAAVNYFYEEGDPGPMLTTTTETPGASASGTQPG